MERWRWLRRPAGGLAALVLLVGCKLATAQDGANDCRAPPPWAAPGQPNAEMAACLRDKAYDARSVNVPASSKVAGIIAQCEVEIDRAEPGMPFGGATGSDDERAARERQVTQWASAAVAAYQPCANR
jgi:hypothetical protein